MKRMNRTINWKLSSIIVLRDSVVVEPRHLMQSRKGNPPSFPHVILAIVNCVKLNEHGLYFELLKFCILFYNISIFLCSIRDFIISAVNLTINAICYTEKNFRRKCFVFSKVLSLKLHQYHYFPLENKS